MKCSVCVWERRKLNSEYMVFSVGNFSRINRMSYLSWENFMSRHLSVWLWAGFVSLWVWSVSSTFTNLHPDWAAVQSSMRIGGQGL